MASDAVLRALEARLGARVTRARPIGGGCVAQALVVDLDGTRVFVKTHAQGAGMFEAEAAGLAWLDVPDALAVPEVLAVGDVPPFLALRFVESAPRRSDYEERLGRGLATLHRASAPRFGLGHDNFIGPLPQDNTEHDDWPSFYRDRRLAPMLDRAVRQGELDAGTRAELECLFSVLHDRCGPPEPPARLHGDLWSGNAMVDERGAPMLIDPAVYGGHREIDLAMMRLFGGFGPRTFDAYQESFPLAPGWRDRIPLYQVYPLLVHVVLFGGSYLPQLRRAVRAVL